MTDPQWLSEIRERHQTMIDSYEASKKFGITAVPFTEWADPEELEIDALLRHVDELREAIHYKAKHSHTCAIYLAEEFKGPCGCWKHRALQHDPTKEG